MHEAKSWERLENQYSDSREKRSHAEKLKDSISDLCTQPGKMALLCVFVCRSKWESEKTQNWACYVSSRAIRGCSTLKSSFEPQETTFIIYFCFVLSSLFLHNQAKTALHCSSNMLIDFKKMLHVFFNFFFPCKPLCHFACS